MKFNPKDLRARDDKVREAHFQYESGHITRREFLRFSSMLGGGALAAALLPPGQRTQLRAHASGDKCRDGVGRSSIRCRLIPAVSTIPPS